MYLDWLTQFGSNPQPPTLDAVTELIDADDKKKNNMYLCLHIRLSDELTNKDTPRTRKFALYRYLHKKLIGMDGSNNKWAVHWFKFSVVTFHYMAVIHH